MQGLLRAVLAISRELKLPVVLRNIIVTAMELVGARYGALGVLDEKGEGLAEFIPVGLNDEEYQDLSGVELPHGRGLLGSLIRHPEPLRVDDIPSHPDSVGFPPRHMPLRTLLGVAISVRGRVYGNLYLSERQDGRPFDEEDETIVKALAGAAGIAVENARLLERERRNAEWFQRMLLPTLPDLSPFGAAAVYRPAQGREARQGHVGGDWYDAVPLPGGAVGLVIGDVIGHDLLSAAVMSELRNMLRALLFAYREPPSAVLTELDRAMAVLTEAPLTTATLALVQPAEDGWLLRWSSAGHPPPLVLPAGGEPFYPRTDPGVPLGVNHHVARPDQQLRLSAGTSLLLFTDGLVEHHQRPLDAGLSRLASLAAAHADDDLDALCRTLAEQRPSDGHDDLALVSLRLPHHPQPA
ncbi:GAF domain-containing protein [Streptomyces hoynatensis]|uniref:GAF domain-containing protein n=2 Tax=Streptomyces hoynatensis TaxID=1141874 RepID=A0A3A9ZCZ5_9ACTN|nr:GAF domain-containing protein [Streptomyces hoynatensis]